MPRVVRVALFAAVFALNVDGGLPVACAQAAPTEDGAHEHYRRGTAAYNLGKYQEAAKEYELAYEATLDPALLFNVAQAYRLAGDRRKAITTYRSYLRSAPNGSQRGLAELKLKELESQPNAEAAPTSSAPPPAPDPSALVAPLSPPPPAPPPAPASPADATTPASSAAPLTLENEAEPASTPLYKSWPFWAVTGAAVVTIVVVAIVVAGGSSSSSPDTNLGTMRF